MTTLESRTVEAASVEERLAAVLHAQKGPHSFTQYVPPFDAEAGRTWVGTISTGPCEPGHHLKEAAAILAAAKEHGLVIGEGERSLDEAWDELKALAERAGYEVRVTAFGAPPHPGDRYQIDSVAESHGLAAEMADLKERLTAKLESRR